ncbi:hypothetical protein EYC84_004945 [Monilinia fructicola]|uniref:Uncharacterized protein n=1 Tax=Monilinia fructicola TaxID=38448 RepID=A0A5M9K4W7_MONFR|nr:hypothetical protein EYC84_004945 [Monilinia fructicola]
MKCDPERSEVQMTLDKRHSSFVPDPETASQMGSTIDPKTFSMHSTPSSNPSPRGNTSSFVDPATLYKLEGFHTSAQSLDFPAPSLEYSSRSHDSIGSVLSTSSDLNFLASYDDMTFDMPTYETYHWWGQNGQLEPAGPTFNDLISFDQSITMSNAPQMEIFQVEDKQPSAFDQSLIEPPQEQLNWSSDMMPLPQSYTMEPTSGPSLRPSSSPMENTLTTTDAHGHCQQDLMEWEAARSSSVTQGYYTNTQEVKPLTEEEREHSSNGGVEIDRPSNRRVFAADKTHMKANLRMEIWLEMRINLVMGMGKKASLREKVKTATVHVPPFSRSLFRTKYTLYQRKVRSWCLWICGKAEADILSFSGFEIIVGNVLGFILLRSDGNL